MQVVIGADVGDVVMHIKKENPYPAKGSRASFINIYADSRRGRLVCIK